MLCIPPPMADVPELVACRHVDANNGPTGVVIRDQGRLFTSAAMWALPTHAV
jgi:hypothetical protein